MAIRNVLGQANTGARFPDRRLPFPGVLAASFERGDKSVQPATEAISGAAESIDSNAATHYADPPRISRRSSSLFAEPATIDRASETSSTPSTPSTAGSSTSTTTAATSIVDAPRGRDYRKGQSDRFKQLERVIEENYGFTDGVKRLNCHNAAASSLVYSKNEIIERATNLLLAKAALASRRSLRAQVRRLGGEGETAVGVDSDRTEMGC